MSSKHQEERSDVICSRYWRGVVSVSCRLQEFFPQMLILFTINSQCTIQPSMHSFSGTIETRAVTCGKNMFYGQYLCEFLKHGIYPLTTLITLKYGKEIRQTTVNYLVVLAGQVSVVINFQRATVLFSFSWSISRLFTCNECVPPSSHNKKNIRLLSLFLVIFRPQCNAIVGVNMYAIRN